MQLLRTSLLTATKSDIGDLLEEMLAKCKQDATMAAQLTAGHSNVLAVYLQYRDNFRYHLDHPKVQATAPNHIGMSSLNVVQSQPDFHDEEPLMLEQDLREAPNQSSWNMVFLRIVLRASIRTETRPWRRLNQPWRKYTPIFHDCPFSLRPNTSSASAAWTHSTTRLTA